MRLLLAALLLATPLAAQEASNAQGATIRLLDKVTGQLTDVELFAGQTARLGQIDIDLEECRYPTGNPAGDAYAYLEIEDRSAEAQIFAGWMVASSPALNALDHPRYDVWVIRCKTS
ncbi:MAG: DUF2155 domain-containing protein [Rhodobacteraceae bacterium]|nr:DUF2155 domain-containing protein [Paracoccaceae bacterium]